jgi:hypothetical protein
MKHRMCSLRCLRRWCLRTDSGDRPPLRGFECVYVVVFCYKQIAPTELLLLRAKGVDSTFRFGRFAAETFDRTVRCACL